MAKTSAIFEKRGERRKGGGGKEKGRTVGRPGPPRRRTLDWGKKKGRKARFSPAWRACRGAWRRKKGKRGYDAKSRTFHPLFFEKRGEATYNISSSDQKRGREGAAMVSPYHCLCIYLPLSRERRKEVTRRPSLSQPNTSHCTKDKKGSSKRKEPLPFPQGGKEKAREASSPLKFVSFKKKERRKKGGKERG